MTVECKSASLFLLDFLLDFILDLSLDGSPAFLRSLLVGSLALLSFGLVLDLAFLLGCWSGCLGFLGSIRRGLRVTAGCLCLQFDAGDAVLDGQRVVFCVAGCQLSLTWSRCWRPHLPPPIILATAALSTLALAVARIEARS